MKRVGEAAVSLFNHPPGPKPPTSSIWVTLCLPFKMGWAGELTAQHRTAQLGARAWAEEPYGFSHSAIYEGIKETHQPWERERRRETTQNEMSNKEYENMRGRRASADRKWNKKAKKEQDRQARHQRSELIERRKHSKQKKHDKHRLLHVRSLTHTHTAQWLYYLHRKAAPL